MKTLKQTDFKDISNIFDGELINFINEYDFDAPQCYQAVGDDTIDLDLPEDTEWRSDIKLDSDFNLYVPTHYKLTDYEHNSAPSASTGYNEPNDGYAEYEAEYDDKPTIKFEDMWKEIKKDILTKNLK
jgi:hypothetical protein